MTVICKKCGFRIDEGELQKKRRICKFCYNQEQIFYNQRNYRARIEKSTTGKNVWENILFAQYIKNDPQGRITFRNNFKFVQ